MAKMVNKAILGSSFAKPVEKKEEKPREKRFKLSVLESAFDTDYLDMLSATGKMDAESKADYDAKRKSEGQDPTLNYTAKVAEKQAAKKQTELESYKASEEYKKIAPKIQTSGTSDPAADAGAFIGSILSNLFQTGNWAGDTKAGQLQAEADYLQGIADKAKNESVILKDLTDFERWPEEDRKDLERYLDYTGRGTATGGLPALLSGATAAKDRLDKKYGRETVRNIIESYSRKLNAEDAEATRKAGQENASLLESLLSVPVSVVGSVTATSDYLGSVLKDVTGVSSGRFSGIDPNTPGAMPGIYAEAVRQGESENVKDWAQATAEIHGADEKTQKAIGAVASTVYTAGMGALDNLTRVYATGGVGSLALAATGSFSSAVRQATLNGASAQQAAAFGFVSAASEVLTEKLPLDNLLDNLASAGSGAGILSILTGAAKQAGIELTTEELNLVAGMAAEALILRENSDYRKGIAEMVAQGTPYNEAVKAANNNLIQQAGQTALQSGLSGFMTSAGTSAVAQMTGANRFTEAAQEYDRQKETAAGTAQRLSDLLNIKKAQTEKGVESQQTAKVGKLEINELVDEVIAKNTGAPADPVGAAVESFASTGTVSNKQASDILNSVKAVQQLVQETGVKLDGLTMAQRRNAVKSAVQTMAQRNAQEDSTSVNTDPAQHTPQEQAVIDEYQNAVDDNLVEYIQTVKDNPGQKMPRYPLKDVSDRAAADIKRITGIAVDGNKTQLESRIVEHIIKDHGENGSADHSMRDLNDIARIQYVIDNYDSIEHGGTSSAYVYQNQHGRNANAQTVIMKKKVNGTYFVVEAVPDTKKKTVFITSAYMSKDGTQKPAESLSGDAEAPRFTSENATKNTADLIGAIAPNTIIPNDSETVNTENGTVDTAPQTVYDNTINQGGNVYAAGQPQMDHGGVQRNPQNDPQRETAGSTADGSRNVQFGHQSRLYGRDGKGTLHTSDSEGRELTPEQSAKLRDTAVTDSRGAPLAVYHITDNMEFTNFAKGDTGFHFGSAEQAARHGKQRGYTKGRTFRVFLNIKNPVRTSKDIMGWHPGGTALLLWNDGVLTESEMQEITALYRKGDGYDSASAVRLREILESKGYDGIVYANGFEGDGDSYIAFNDNQILRSDITAFSADGEAKVTDSSPGNSRPNPSVGAAEYNFSGKAQYQDLLYEGNVQRDREGDVRPMDVPKTDPYGRNVSEFVGNAYGAEITPDKMAGAIEELVQEGALGFDRRSNQEALNEAAGEIEEKGMARIRNQITRNVSNGKLQDGDIEKAMLLYSMYANKKGEQAQDNAAEMFVDLTTMAHMSGRNLQLFGLLRKLTPEGQASTIKKMVQKNVENMVRSGRVKKGYETEVDPDLLKEYQEAARENMRAVSDEQKQETQERMQKIQQAIFAAEAAKMPATFKAKWDAWRYMAMLGNAKTQIRNMVGNLLFMPYKDAKDKMAAVFEKALPKEQRTKAIGTDRDLLAWAKNDAKTTDIHNALLYSAKLGDDAASAQFAENRKVFDSKALDAVRKFVEKVPQAGDMLFKNGYYARSLASFLKARGYKASDIQNGNISAAVLSEARGYAIQEAMKATFNDCNAFSDAVASIGRKKTDNIWGKALNVAAEGILPFRRTPANIAVRFAEYSPAGLVKGMWDMATKVRSGDLSASAAIDQIAAGLTGSGVMALGFLLAKGIAGVKITGSGTDEDEKRQGHQDYAVEFSVNGQAYSYKIDWAAPANLPLFVGANIYKAMEEAGADTDVSTFTAILHGMGTMFEPMLALSCMSSLNDLVEGIRYAPEGEALYSAVADIATSYFLQGVPALLRQAYQASQVNKQTTFANSDDPTIRDLQKLGAQIPFVGAAFQTDKVNAWGETETTESGLQRVANAFLNPGTVKQIENSEVEKEITRLNSSQDKNVSPLSAERTVTYTDKDGRHHKNERLTEEQYNAIAKKQGAAQRELVENLIVSEDYKALRDAEKAAVISSAYAFARETVRAETLDGYEPSANWLKEAKGNEVQYIINKTVSDSLYDAFGNDSDQALDAAYDVYMKLGANARAKITEDASGRVKYFLTAKQNGISTDTFRELYKTYDALYDNDSLKASAKASQWSYELEKAQEQGTITSSQKAALKEEMNFWQMIPAETSRFDTLTENGLSADKAYFVTELLDSILPPAGESGVTQQQKVQAVTSADSRLSDKEQQQVLKEVLSESAYGKFLEILELGYSNDDYSDSYRIYTAEKETGGKGTKARTIEAFRKEFGISEAAATALYEIYNPK